MKTLAKLAIVIVMVSIAFTSCKKSKKTSPVGALGPNFPYVLNTIVTPAILDSLENHGLEINGGLTPALVNGIYLFSPNEVSYDSSDGYYAGQIIDDYKYQFSEQNNDAFTINMKYKDITAVGTNTGSANGATIISGNGNSFTVYAQAQDTTQGVYSVIIQVISGQLASGGIKNMQLAYYEKSKGSDPNNLVVPVGTIRIFKDEDGFSQTQSTFSVDPNKVQNIYGNYLKSNLAAARQSK
ncbi:MAG TPA: hypothetical protein VFE53_25115 [Mucilaginibacter sp.]|jgi:hypothetical protein|nr:hypothetical protein [Mucilaginibacter sp.]